VRWPCRACEPTGLRARNDHIEQRSRSGHDSLTKSRIKSVGRGCRDPRTGTSATRGLLTFPAGFDHYRTHTKSSDPRQTATARSRPCCRKQKGSLRRRILPPPSGTAHERLPLICSTSIWQTRALQGRGRGARVRHFDISQAATTPSRSPCLGDGGGTQTPRGLPPFTRGRCRCLAVVSQAGRLRGVGLGEGHALDAKVASGVSVALADQPEARCLRAVSS
jgi:hypothetical protein